MVLTELEFYKEQIEAGLDRFLPSASTAPALIHEAMRYSTCGGGKRLRGLLTLLACQVVDGSWQAALPAACALEMVHAYSLIHDDLPCMDDDELRRGKPTNHRVYGEGIALLAGDALLTQAVETMICFVPTGLEKNYWQALQELIKACNTQGMIGGQVLDLSAEGKQLTLAELQAIHRWKTGALIRAALRIGGIIGGGDEEALRALSAYGEAFGLVFQITDDLLDLEAETAVLGKTTGSDLRKQKATYPALLGVEEARRHAGLEIEKARCALEAFGEKARLLRELAEYVLQRSY